MKEKEECRNINESRIFYTMVNRDRNVFKPRITMCRDTAGNFITGKAQILKRWVQYFDNLLNRNVSTQQLTEQDIERNEDFRPTKEETEEAIENLKNNKTPGIDSVQAELL
jgi:hypothetical protein